MALYCQESKVSFALLTVQCVTFTPSHLKITSVFSFTDGDSLYLHKEQGQHVSAGTYQDEVRLIGGQHEDGDVVVGQGCNDGLGDLGDPNGLRAGGAAATRHHIQGQPGGVRDADVFRLRQL